MARKRIQDWAYDVLAGNSGPTNYRDIAQEIQRQGYSPSRGAKSESQFHRSVWVALTRDDRVVKVAPGTFDLAVRGRRK